MAEKIKYDGPTGVVADRKVYGYSSSYTCVDEEKNLVEVVAVSRCKDGKDVFHTTRFDFTDFSRSELLELAARPTIIAARTPEFRTRNSAEAIKALERKTLNAKEFFKRERRTKTFEDKVKELTNEGIKKEDAELMLRDPVAFYMKMQDAMAKATGK